MGSDRELKVDPVTFVCRGCGFTYGPQNPTGSPAGLISSSRDGKWRIYPLLARKDGTPVVGDAVREVSATPSGESEIECSTCEARVPWGKPIFSKGGIAYVSGREPRAFSWLTEDPLDE